MRFAKTAQVTSRVLESLRSGGKMTVESYTGGAGAGGSDVDIVRPEVNGEEGRSID